MSCPSHNTTRWTQQQFVPHYVPACNTFYYMQRIAVVFPRVNRLPCKTFQWIYLNSDLENQSANRLINRQLRERRNGKNVVTSMNIVINLYEQTFRFILAIICNEFGRECVWRMCSLFGNENSSATLDGKHREFPIDISRNTEQERKSDTEVTALNKPAVCFRFETVG